MNSNVIKIQLPNTPQAEKALEAIKQAIAERQHEHQKKDAGYARKLKKPTL